MERDFLPSKKVGDFFNKKFVFVNAQSGQKVNKVVESMYGVGCHPTFLFLDGDGKEIARFSDAAKDEDKFIEKIAFYAKKENSREAQKKRFLEDKSYGEQYMKYITDSYLRDEFEFAGNIIFNRLKGNKEKQHEFLKKNLKGMALYYFKNLRGSIFNYLYNNKEEAKKVLGMDDQTYERTIGAMVSGCITKMLIDCNYSPLDYQKILDVYKKYPQFKQYTGLQFKAIKPAKEKGLDGIVEVFESEVFKLSARERQYANYFFLRNYGHMVEKNAKLKKYLEKCYEMEKGKRGARLYKEMLGIK